jgi:hypothetical protein
MIDWCRRFAPPPGCASASLRLAWPPSAALVGKLDIYVNGIPLKLYSPPHLRKDTCGATQRCGGLFDIPSKWRRVL